MSLVNTDIYNIVDSINELKKQYIDEDEETLAIGVFGYLGDLEAKKIQTSILMTNTLSNEVFPNRSILDKNIITHSMMYGIKNINATPAYMTILIGILESDLDKYMNDNKLIIDKDVPIIIEDKYEFHLDYDIILSRVSKNGVTTYAAVYDMTHKNRISTIDNYYLNQPYAMQIGTTKYVFIQATIRQVSIKNEYSQIITSSIIDNKTFTFKFENQLADFDVIVTENGKETYVTPVFEGNGIDSNIEKYCYYVYVNEDTVRIKFDRTSYMPSLNAEIKIVIKTTLGSEGIFNYTTNSFVSFTSEKYGYYNMNILIRPNTNSTGGVDRKSVDELHQILPKEILSKGSISTETDLTNYFNLINTNENMLIMQRKTDNQIDRIYYAYFLMKNKNGDIVPTNTINLKVNQLMLKKRAESGSYYLPAGSYIKYSPSTFIGEVVDEKDIKDTDEYVYTTLYAVSITEDPLYAAFYMTIINENKYLSFEWINQEAEVQFISQNVHFERNMLTDKDTYKLSFTTIQNINTDMGMYIEKKNEDTGEWELLENNMKTFVVLYKDGSPYRYKEASIESVDMENYKYNWQVAFNTNNYYDDNNDIYIEDLKTSGEGFDSYGYINPNCEVYIYTLAKFDSEDGRYDLDSVIPNLDGYTVTNKYKIQNGLNFFFNYSGILSSRIKVTEYTDLLGEKTYTYHLSGVPVIGYSYLNNEENVLDFLDQMNYKKLYIDEALYVLENSFEIDFKFCNTYGPSRTYTVDLEGKTSIGRIDIVPRFEIGLVSSSDIYTKNKIITFIKEYIEEFGNIGDIHILNLTAEINKNFNNVISYCAYKGFNLFDANKQHMYKQDVENKNIPPEFINIRTKKDDAGNVVPDVVIDIVI